MFKRHTWFTTKRQRYLAAIGKVHARRNEIRMAIIFVGLIILPSGILGYFSWRAIESEKLLTDQRLQKNYRQLSHLARREIDDELKKARKRWFSVVKSTFSKKEQRIDIAKLDEISTPKNLIAAAFLLTSPGEVAYPLEVSLEQDAIRSESWKTDVFLREYKVFTKLVAEGEELEYIVYDLEKAIASYQQVVTQVANPQLCAMALSYIGRAQMKKSDWTTAQKTFQTLLLRYPEVRDLNKMYLRFPARYQIAVCLDNLGQDLKAVEILLHLNKELLKRSDAINQLQYSYFLNLIRNLTSRLLSSSGIADIAHEYKAQFDILAEQNKKRYSQKYFLQLLDRKLYEMVVERKRYREKIRYASDEADNEPFLLAYHQLPGPSGIYTTGLLGIQIDLPQLRKQLFPAILKNLKFSEEVILAIINDEDDLVIGTAQPMNQPVAVQTLASPFDFWKVAVYVDEPQLQAQRWNFNATLSLWLISLLLLSIFAGVYIFFRRARHEAFLSQMKSTFVSNVSHELRTPLASIKMLAELLEMQLLEKSGAISDRLKERTQQYLTTITRECDRLGRLIENVLSFSKIERGVKEYHFEYEDPGVVLYAAIESFRPNADANNFSLKVDIQKDLPELRMDADAISQVMLNLLTNAVKYSDETKDIDVLVFKSGTELKITVTDKGVGLPKTEQEKIFNEFYRVDEKLNTQQQGGMGLGLTLVQHIVRGHKGSITVQSELGKGSIFTVTLPFQDDIISKPIELDISG